MPATLDDIQVHVKNIKDILANIYFAVESLESNISGGTTGGSKGKKDEGVGVMDVLGAGIGAVTGAIAKLEASVGAFSPAILQQFNFALEDLQATIGQAFAPAFKILTELVRQAADTIAPLMEQLAPIMAELAKALGEALMPVLRVLVAAFQFAMPVIKFVVYLLSLLARAIDYAVKAFAAFVRGLGFGGLADTLEGKGGVRKTAAREAEMGSLEDFQRQRDIAAASAGGAGDPMLGLVGGIAEDVHSIAGKKGAGIGSTIGMIVGGIGGAILGGPLGAVAGAAVGSAAGSAVGGAISGGGNIVDISGQNDQGRNNVDRGTVRDGVKDGMDSFSRDLFRVLDPLVQLALYGKRGSAQPRSVRDLLD